MRTAHRRLDTQPVYGTDRQIDSFSDLPVRQAFLA